MHATMQVLEPFSPANLSNAVRALLEPADTLPHAEALTRKLAHEHYENFSVVSMLLPRHLRQDFCNVYAFCRIADDLGDEMDDSETSLDYLAQFREHLRACYRRETSTAVFLALSLTIDRHEIPIEPFLDLIDAFEQDQRVKRYETHEELINYCRRSADPVGRIVLYMAGYRDSQRQQLSDHICTALQLTNFWQDVRRDLLELDRIYIPTDTMHKFGVTEQQLRAGNCDDRFRAMLKFEIDRTEQMFTQGEQLLPLLDYSIRPQISLFSTGGRAILQAIRQQNYNTLSKRPSLSAFQKSRLIFHALLGGLLSRVRSRG